MNTADEEECKKLHIEIKELHTKEKRAWFRKKWWYKREIKRRECKIEELENDGMNMQYVLDDFRRYCLDEINERDHEIFNR
jgi:cell fate (sporulation/competence/biofilm development) regulator YmcA (YheA/YmcA/DUF963 family)